MNSSDIVVIFCTIPVAESEEITRALVERRLVAGVNSLPVHSCYRWNGEFCSELEHLLIAKMKESLKTGVIAAIRLLNHYEIPDIIAVSISAGYSLYLAWVHAGIKDEI